MMRTQWRLSGVEQHSSRKSCRDTQHLHARLLTCTHLVYLLWPSFLNGLTQSDARGSQGWWQSIQQQLKTPQSKLAMPRTAAVAAGRAAADVLFTLDKMLSARVPDAANATLVIRVRDINTNRVLVALIAQVAQEQMSVCTASSTHRWPPWRPAEQSWWCSSSREQHLQAHIDRLQHTSEHTMHWTCVAMKAHQHPRLLRHIPACYTATTSLPETASR
jgi:hypothetical protein